MSAPTPERKMKRWEQEFEEDLAEKPPREEFDLPDESELEITPQEKEKFKQYLKFLLSKMCAKKSERKRLFRAMMLPKKELRKVLPAAPAPEEEAPAPEAPPKRVHRKQRAWPQGPPEGYGYYGYYGYPYGDYEW